MAVDLLAAAMNVKAAASKAPTSELGASTSTGLRPLSGFIGGSRAWSDFADESELLPDLKWAPGGGGQVGIYEKMRTDPQVAAIMWAIKMPIRRYCWFVDPNGATERSATEFAQDLNLPLRDEPREMVGRMKGRFNHDDHLRQALLALDYGHMYFEQVGEIVDGRFRLRKLAPRLPASIQRIELNQTGGLAAIYQWGNGVDGLVRIPVERLVAYVWDLEGATWTGRSLLRAMYGPWLIKQTLIRVDAVKHERNGMGIPIVKEVEANPDPAARLRALELARSLRVGQVAGVDLPAGFDLELKGVSGSLPDTLASIRYCDEQMARAAGLMQIMLGTTATGSRSLGETFDKGASDNQRTIADWYLSVTNPHVGEDWTDWNDGDLAQAPRVAYSVDDHDELAVADMLLAIESGLLTLSAEDEDAFREYYNLPARDPDLPRREIPAGISPALEPA